MFNTSAPQMEIGMSYNEIVCISQTYRVETTALINSLALQRKYSPILAELKLKYSVTTGSQLLEKLQAQQSLTSYNQSCKLNTQYSQL